MNCSQRTGPKNKWCDYCIMQERERIIDGLFQLLPPTDGLSHYEAIEYHYALLKEIMKIINAK